jgi:hypothetical protein
MMATFLIPHYSFRWLAAGVHAHRCSGTSMARHGSVYTVRDTLIQVSQHGPQPKDGAHGAHLQYILHLKPVLCMGYSSKPQFTALHARGPNAQCRGNEASSHRRRFGISTNAEPSGFTYILYFTSRTVTEQVAAVSKCFISRFRLDRLKADSKRVSVLLNIHKMTLHVS